MSPKAHTAPPENAAHGATNVNVNKQERLLSLAMGAALLGLGLRHASKLRGLVIASVGGALAYRGVTGHCHVYEALGVDTEHGNEEMASGDRAQRERGHMGMRAVADVRGSVAVEAADALANEGSSTAESFEVSARNQVDKQRFDKLKATQIDRGREKEKAIEIAAEEVKELRRREGRSKEDDETLAEKLDQPRERR